METTENPMFTIADNCFLQFFQLYKPSPGAGQEPRSFCPEWWILEVARKSDNRKWYSDTHKMKEWW